MFEELVKDSLVDLSVHADDQNTLFEVIGNRLISKGFAKPSYVTALKEREANYPTGLETKCLSIAIPHTDTNQIEIPFIYIARMVNPVEFKQMGDNKKLRSEFIFFLGIKDPSKQVGLLSKLMNFLREESLINELRNAKDNQSVVKLIKQYL